MAIVVTVDVYIAAPPNRREKYQQGSKQLKESLGVKIPDKPECLHYKIKSVSNSSQYSDN